VNLRLKTYIQLIPPTLLLGGLYLFSLLLFNRRDAYDSASAQIEDRTSIIEAFIEAENPDSIESLRAYLDINLSESKERLLRDSSDFQISIRDSKTQGVLYVWAPDPETNASTDRKYAEIRQLKLDAFDPPLVLVVSARHPIHVFLNRNFWMDIALVMIVLIFVGALLAEIVVRIIKGGLSGVDINAVKLADFPDWKSKHKGSKIKELDELSNSINTLFDSYEAKRSEKGALLSNPSPMLEPSDLLQRIRRNSETADSITLEKCDCTLWKNSPDSPLYISFLFPHDLQIFAFVGFPYSTFLGFEAGIMENIVKDTIRQSPKKEGVETLPIQLESLRLFRKWTLLKICPGKRELREFHSGDQPPKPGPTSFEAHSKLVIPIGFTLSTPIPQMILDSKNWKILVGQLFENHPESAVLCIDSRM
jgi:hypothetical protein